MHKRKIILMAMLLPGIVTAAKAKSENRLGQSCPPGSRLEKSSLPGSPSTWEICTKENGDNHGPYLEIRADNTVVLKWFENDSGVKVPADEVVKANKYNEAVSARRGVNVGFKPWKKSGEIVRVKGDVLQVGTFANVSAELKDLSKEFAVIDAGLNGKWVVHMPKKIKDRHFRKQGPALVKCKPVTVQTYSDGTKSVHCDFVDLGL